MRGARLGLTRQGIENAPAQVGAAFDEVLEALEAAGATVIDLDAAGFAFAPADGEFLVLVYEFRNDVRDYFATRTRVPLAGKTLADAIAFNEANADEEMPFFAQEIFELANSLALGPDDPQPAFGGMTYNQALEIDRLSGVNGIDKALAGFRSRCGHCADGQSGLGHGPALWRPLPVRQLRPCRRRGLSHRAGAREHGVRRAARHQLLRHGVQRAHADRLASGFEAVTRVRAQNPPTFALMLPDDHIDGSTLRRPRAAKAQQGKQPKAQPQETRPWRPRRM